MATQAQNLSREMILPAYKAAISPEPPIPPRSPIRATTHQPRTTRHEPRCTMHEPRTTTHEPRTNMQNEPNLVRLRRIQNPLFDKGLRQNKALRQDPKTNPNEPKRTQNEPNFSLVRGPQSQNEPKQTQFVAAKPACHGQVPYEAGLAKPDQTQQHPILRPHSGRVSNKECPIRLQRTSIEVDAG
jgi:hypothetical protein